MPLIEWLEKRTRNLKLLLGTDVDLRVVIASDNGIPFETVRMIMYTAGQAQHSEFEHLQPSFAGLRLKGSDLPTIGPLDGKGGILDNPFVTPKADKDGAESSKAANTPGGHLLKQRMADKLKSNAKAKAQKTSAEEQP